MAAPSYTYTLTNGSTADATQVQQNFTDILNGVADGTKDLSISALTCAGTVTLNGNVNIGNASSDDLTITASLASAVAIKTNNSYDIGSATLGLRKIYIGNGGAGATCDIISASHATTREYTIPDCGAAASFVMTQLAQTISGVKTFDGQLIGKGTATNDAAAVSYIGEYMENIFTGTLNLVNSQFIDVDSGGGSPVGIVLTAGCWDITGSVVFYPAATTSYTTMQSFIGTTTGNTSTGYDVNRNFASEATAATVGGGNQVGLNTPPWRVKLAGSTTYYLKAYSVFTIASMSATGCLRATRIR